MANDLLDRFTPLHNQPTNILAASIAPLVLSGAHAAIRFPNGQSRHAYFASVMSALYNGSGIIVRIVWKTPVADVTKSVNWSAAFERHAAESFDFDGAEDFDSAVTVSAFALATGSLAIYTDISFSNTQIADLEILESYRLRVSRGNDDTVANYADLYRVFLLNAG